ncbi:hypothetical protein VYU27_003172 [Nannochloropsis oceanica]
MASQADWRGGHGHVHGRESRGRGTPLPNGAQSKLSLDFFRSADLHLRDSCTLSLYVPIEQVGLVIGKKGAKIKYIQDASRARVSVEPTEDVTDSAWSLVSVRGKPSGCFTAARMIAGLVEELDDCIAQFPLFKSRLVQVIGKSSANLRRISADTNVRIYIPGWKDKESNYVQLEGEVDAVLKAVVEVVDAAYSGGGYRSSSNAGGDREGESDGQVAMVDEATTPIAAAYPITSKGAPTSIIEEIIPVSISQLDILTKGSTSAAIVLISKHTGTRIKKESKPREKENGTVPEAEEQVFMDKSQPKDKEAEEGGYEEGGGEGGGPRVQITSSVSPGSAVVDNDGGDEADSEFISLSPQTGQQGEREGNLIKICVTGADEKAVLAAVGALREVGEGQASLLEAIARLKIEFPAFQSGNGGRSKSKGGIGRVAWKSSDGGGSRLNKRG